jgi:hypothetical protein
MQAGKAPYRTPWQEHFVPKTRRKRQSYYEKGLAIISSRFASTGIEAGDLHHLQTGIIDKNQA